MKRVQFPQDFLYTNMPPIHCFVHKYGRRDVMFKRSTKHEYAKMSQRSRGANQLFSAYGQNKPCWHFLFWRLGKVFCYWRYCCFFTSNEALLSYVQTDATTPNIVARTMLRVVGSELQWCANGCNNSQQHATGCANVTCNIHVIIHVTCNIQQCWELLANNVASICTRLNTKSVACLLLLFNSFYKRRL